MKVAFVHDWLVTYAGAERVLEQMLHCFPEADLFSLIDFLPPGKRDFIHNKPVGTTFVQSLPLARIKYRSYLPLMPLAMEQLDLSGYELVVSNSHAVAKGVITGPNQLHVCMCHAPIRYAWDLQHQYLKESGLDRGVKGWFAKAMLHRMRGWDLGTANGVDVFFASSEFTKQRIRKVYRRETDAIVNPPVDIAAFPRHDAKADFFVTASRMVPYKRIDLIVDAFAKMPDKKLFVIGTGPDHAKIAARCPSNVELLGYQEHAVMRDYMQRAQAFVFAAEEDFGIVPVEAQACGTPVIAYGYGGTLDTVIGIDKPRSTGLFFYQQTVECLIDAVGRFTANRSRFTPTNCRANAERFSNEVFRACFTSEITRALSTWRRTNAPEAAEAIG